jgi:hypothetical protein
MIDYLLHHGLKDKLHPNLLIGTSNCTAYFDVMNRKTIGSPPMAAADSKTVQRTRDKYRLPITQDVFTQQHITQFRLGLASELSTVPVPSLRPEFLSSFFPKLSNESQLALSPARFTTNNPTCSSETGLVKKQAVDYTLKETEKATESNILKDPTAEQHSPRLHGYDSP